MERITGISVGDLRETVHTLATAPSAMILTARGAEQHSNGTDTAQAFINLALALGLPGKWASGYGTITGQGNGQGGREHGQKADQLPGYRRLDDPAARAHVAGVWGIDPRELPQPGKSAFEMLDRLGTDGGRAGAAGAGLQHRGVRPGRQPGPQPARRRWTCWWSPTSSCPRPPRIADVVLPTAQWAEEDGTMTNLEGRVIRRKRALPPPVGVLDDLQMLHQLADRLGRGQYFSADPAVVFDELRRASAGGIADYAGITYERIDAEQGVFWPCPARRPSRARRGCSPTRSPPRTAGPGSSGWCTGPGRDAGRGYPYVLTTGRLMTQYQSGTQTRRVRARDGARPARAAPPGPGPPAMGIAASDMVELRTRRGAAVFRAQLSDAIRPDALFVPFHWGGASNANALTDPALDPHSKMPAFKVVRGDPDPGRRARRRPTAAPHPRAARRGALHRRPCG